MRVELLSRTNLLATLAAIGIFKLVIVPLWTWQNEILEDLQAKNLKLSKLSSVISNHENLRSQLNEIQSDMQMLTQLFFLNHDTIKLSVQKEIENMFEKNSVKIEGFNWVFDSENGVVRSLRASIKYSGSTEDVIKTFWDLLQIPQVIDQLEWRSRFVAGNDSLGNASGDLTLEFFAISEAVYASLKNGSRADDSVLE